jgi:hypothetical protein
MSCAQRKPFQILKIFSVKNQRIFSFTVLALFSGNFVPIFVNFAILLKQCRDQHIKQRILMPMMYFILKKYVGSAPFYFKL